MCNGGREFLRQDKHLTSRELVSSLSDVVIGRPVDEAVDLYVVDARADGDELTLELSDGSSFSFLCRKVE